MAKKPPAAEQPAPPSQPPIVEKVDVTINGEKIAETSIPPGAQERIRHWVADEPPDTDAAIEAALERALEHVIGRASQQAVAEALASRTPELLPLPAPLQSSGKIDGLMRALAAAQGELQNPPKDKTATIASEKGRYQYDYADLATVLDVLRPIFSKHGLAVAQIPSTPDARTAEVWTGIFFGGEWIACALKTSIADGRPQTLGSAITYLRRYSIQSLAGITAEADDDASSAQGVDAETGPRQRASQPQQRQAAQTQRSAPPPAQPAASVPSGETVGTRSGKIISEAQRKRLNAIITDRAAAIGAKADDFREVIREYLRKAVGVDSSKDLPEGRYDEVVKYAQSAVMPAAEREPGEEG